MKRHIEDVSIRLWDFFSAHLSFLGRHNSVVPSCVRILNVFKVGMRIPVERKETSNILGYCFVETKRHRNHYYRERAYFAYIEKRHARNYRFWTTLTSVSRYIHYAQTAGFYSARCKWSRERNAKRKRSAPKSGNMCT